MNINNGGPAFPVEVLDKQRNGMTLRDYFAAMAMQAVIEKRSGIPNQEAQFAYEIADAMLKARQK